MLQMERHGFEFFKLKAFVNVSEKKRGIYLRMIIMSKIFVSAGFFIKKSVVWAIKAISILDLFDMNECYQYVNEGFFSFSSIIGFLYPSD